MPPTLTGEERDYLALYGVPGVGAKTCARLVRMFGSPGAVFDADEGDLMSVQKVGAGLARAIRECDRDGYVDDQIKRMEAADARLIARSSAGYPDRLKVFASAPPVLFVRGDAGALADDCIAFVGTRTPTDYGDRMARTLAGDAVDAGMCVVSGMAAGIDTASHHAALDRGGRTVAVFGCGVDIIHPVANRALAGRIAGNGCLVSHFPMGTEASKGTFPARNAVIVGLSVATVVVEAPKESGALITARLTLKAGRPLFSVPANADNDTAKGTNDLFGTGALPAASFAQVLAALGRKTDARAFQASRNTRDAGMATTQVEAPLPDGIQGDILRALAAGRLQVDELCARLDAPIWEVAAALTDLELDGRTREHPGKVFERVA